MGKNLYIGCDVGVTGGISGIDDDGNIVFKERIPRIKTNVDLPALAKLFIHDDFDNIYVAIEDVHSIYGSSAKSNFSFGQIKGIKIGIVTALQLPYVLVQPKTWQKFIWVPSDKVVVGSKTDTKATSLTPAKRLFPKESFLATERSTKPHDGIVDSVLIAQYCKNYF